MDFVAGPWHFLLHGAMFLIVTRSLLLASLKLVRALSKP